VQGGPFLWLRGAVGHGQQFSAGDDESRWSAEHDGYRALDPPVTHRRTAVLDHRTGVLRVEDTLDAAASLRLAWHLGPEVSVELDGPIARLHWPTGTATAELPAELTWTAHRGETAPILGWYSPRFGHRVESTTLIGSGRVGADSALVSRFRFRH
jgi:hypothetical protein